MIMQRLLMFFSAAAFVIVAFSLALLAGASAVYADGYGPDHYASLP